MRKGLLAFGAVLALTTVAAVATLATSEPAEAQTVFTCEARSPYAVGWGSHYDRSVAWNRALVECAVRTPQGYVCNITACAPY